LGLLVGIISDTGRFKHAKAPAFCAVGEILEQTGLEYAEALEILSTMPSDLSQRIAIIKAAMRASVDWVEEWIVVTTQVNAFEGAAAMSLIDLGADIAFAAGRHGSNSRVSGRARRSTSNNVNLAEIMRGIAANYNGEGGGHRGAAALEAPASPEVLLMECKNKALQILQHL
jgi:nanoRNase/pAp phosphatase (c-di-AMP/oligoRNAs hydrolase)